MSILSALLEGKITWDQAKTQIGSWFQSIGNRVLNDPAASQAINELQTVAKQGASDALGLVDTGLAAHMAEAVQAIEGAVDGLLLKATGGAALPAVPLIDTAITKAMSILHSALHAKEMELRASLTPTQPSPPHPGS